MNIQHHGIEVKASYRPAGASCPSFGLDDGSQESGVVATSSLRLDQGFAPGTVVPPVIATFAKATIRSRRYCLSLSGQVSMEWGARATTISRAPRMRS